LGYKEQSFSGVRQDIYKNSNVSKSEIDEKHLMQVNKQITTITDQLKSISNLEERAATELNSVF